MWMKTFWTEPDLSFPDDVKVGQAKNTGMKFFTVCESDMLCTFVYYVTITKDGKRGSGALTTFAGINKGESVA